MIAVLALFTSAFISGCNSYQLGNPAELPFESIYIKPVSNDSFAPQAQEGLHLLQSEEEAKDVRGEAQRRMRGLRCRRGSPLLRHVQHGMALGML